MRLRLLAALAAALVADFTFAYWGAAVKIGPASVVFSCAAGHPYTIIRWCDDELFLQSWMGLHDFGFNANTIDGDHLQLRCAWTKPVELMN
jgi:hypothetical protein